MRIVGAARQAQGEGLIDAAALRYQAAVEVVRELRVAEPHDGDHHRQLGSLLYRLGDLLIRLGNLTEAIDVLDEAERAYGALISSIDIDAVGGLIADVRVRRARALAGVGRSASALVLADAAVTWYVVHNGGVDPQVVAVAAATFGHHVNPSPVTPEYLVFDLARVLADQSEIVLACGDPDIALNAALAALHIYTANSRSVVALPIPQRTVAGQSLHTALRIARAITSARDISYERIVAASVLGTRFERVEGDTADIVPARLLPPPDDEIRRRVTFEAALAAAGTAGHPVRELLVAWDPGDGPVTSSERCAPDDLDTLGVALAALAAHQRASAPAMALRLALEANVALAAAAHRRDDSVRQDPHNALAWARLVCEFSQGRADAGDQVLARDIAEWMAEPIDALLPTVRQEPDAMEVVVDCLEWLRHLWEVDGDESRAQNATRVLATLYDIQPQ